MISKILSLPNLKHEQPVIIVWAHFNDAKLHAGRGMPGSLGIALRAREKDDQKSPFGAHRSFSSSTVPVTVGVPQPTAERCARKL
jgi:hypothetical protein